MKIVVIGLNRPDVEWFTVLMIGQWLEDHRPGYRDLAGCLKLGALASLDLYDMTTRPEKGDALDAIDGSTAMVLALHLFGIDKLPGGNTAKVTGMDPLACYNRNNLELLQLCMRRSIPLVAVGDQPWLGLERRTRMYGKVGEPEIYLYEKREAKAEEAAA